MQTIKAYVHQYFEDHKDFLITHYPGLRVSRLLDDFLEVSGKGCDDLFCSSDKSFFLEVALGRPLEYIKKNSYFYRSKFYVDERVLIPRSETEILVEDSVHWVHSQGKNSLRIAEVGVGSFALGLSVLIDSKVEIDFWGGDISAQAIEVAKLNLFHHKNNLSSKHKIMLEKSDRLEKAQAGFDFIVSNPPYIKEKEDRAGVHQQADSFEPHLALYLPDNKFDSWFEELFQDCSVKLNKGGAFFMEGHEDSLLQLKDIALKYFQTVETKKDYTGRLRFMYAYK